MSTSYYVYIVASRRNGTIYTGMCNNIARRAYEHREGLCEGFTKKYGVKMLVYYETYDDPGTAIWREKRIKKWKRRWKLELIEKMNPAWKDLYETLA